MKSEKEKMISGEFYMPWKEDLPKERMHAKEVVFEYNNLNPKEKDKRKELLRELFSNSPKEFLIEPPFRCDYGYNILWGENSYANYNLTILDCAKVTIGENVLIGPNVGIFTASHPINPVDRKSGLESAQPITICDNVWIGGGSIINPGVTIGENSIIGSGSVVTKDIPKNVIAVGNPCKVIKEIEK